MHQLHIHTCYITYPIDLKSPLFTFISHTTFLLNKVWTKNILEFLHIYNITKLYGGVWTLICIAWCPQWYLFRTVNLYIFILYTKLVIIKRNEEHLSLHHIPPLYAPFMYAHKLSPGPLKVSLQKIHACFIFLSQYMQWRSLYLKRKHDTYIGLQNPLITVTIYVYWLLYSHGLTVQLCICSWHDQLNAPHGTSSVASHYLTTIVPTCWLVSTLHLHSYKIHK